MLIEDETGESFHHGKVLGRGQDTKKFTKAASMAIKSGSHDKKNGGHGPPDQMTYTKMATMHPQAYNKPNSSFPNSVIVGAGAPTKHVLKMGITNQEILKIEGSVEELAKLGGVKGVAHKLRVDPNEGVKSIPEEIQFRSESFGANKYPVKTPKRYLEFLWEAFQDETLLILIACAVVSLVVGLTTEDPKKGWYDGAGIGFAVILVVLVASTSDWKQSLQFMELSAEKRKIMVHVTRSGRRCRILIFDLVVGDIVHINIGDQIPADGLLVEGHSLVIDESSMTGESDPMVKEKERPFLLSGCKVLDGFGTILVTSVGMNTEWGKVMATLSEEVDENTPLQERLDSLATTIGKVGLGIAVIVFFVLLIRFLAQVDFKHFTGDDGRQIVDFFAIAVTIVVVAVPEGLPLAVTLTLAYSMAKMMDDRALVRHLAACETMGSATTICSDKTGTLTMNQMVVVNNWICGRLRKKVDVEGCKEEIIQTIHEAICINTNGNVFSKDGVVPEVTGSPTETAILTWGIKLGARFSEVRENVTTIAVEAFNSSKKCMGIVFKKSGKTWLHWKGAAEILLEQCTRVMEEDGNILPMTSERREEISLIISAFANAALRTLCFAYREMTDEDVRLLNADGSGSTADPTGASDDGGGGGGHSKKTKKTGQPMLPTEAAAAAGEADGSSAFAAGAALGSQGGGDMDGGSIDAAAQQQQPALPQTDLICLSIIGIKDPCRPGVPDAVARCQRAGIAVRMVTGDNIQTAVAIATECGIFTDEGQALEGKDFRRMTPEQQYSILPGVQVMARASPTDKHMLVKRLLEMQEIVAVTGDGTNDAPALHEASIGLSMGIAGTEVAKESSDIIILDDNFASIVKVVSWGRSIYVNIQKFIQFQTTVNGVALGINFVSAIASGSAPLTAVQLLWVNLIMDTLGALALATEPPNALLMDRPPVKRNEPLITNIMWRNIVSQSTATPEEDEEAHRKADKTLVCMIFNAFVFCQICNEVNARKPENVNIFADFFNNRIFCYVLIFTVIIQCLIVEFAGEFASTTHLSWKNWLICVALGLVSWPLAAVVKFIPVPRGTYLSIIMFWKASEVGDDSMSIFKEDAEEPSDDSGAGALRAAKVTSYPRAESFFTRLKYAFFPSTIPMVVIVPSPSPATSPPSSSSVPSTTRVTPDAPPRMKDDNAWTTQMSP